MPQRFARFLCVASFAVCISLSLLTSALAQEPQQPQPSQPAPVPAAQPSIIIAAPVALPPKQPGVIRIGVIRPLSLIGPEATFDTSGATRDLFMSFLGGPLAEVVPIDSRVQIQVVAESKLKDCDYVIYSAIARKRGTSGVSKVIGTAAPVMGLLPAAGALTGTTKSLSSTVSQAERVLKAATDLSGQIQAKDEVIFEYKVVVTGSTTPMAMKLFSKKAESDGDSVIPTLLADAANAILEAVVKKP